MSTTARPSVSDRIAGAPISWGVCEVPGWGFQLAVDSVLREMREVGIVATEFGPDGFLPDEPVAKAEALEAAGLRAVGQFVPVVLHDPGHDPLPEVESAMEALTVAGATTVVVAAATGVEGYDARPELDDAQWDTLLANLDLVTAAAEARGLTATLHPHVGTLVESGEETERVLAGSRIGLCLDTGHLLIGGGDPVQIARAHPGRIGHVHLKDVRLDIAERVRAGSLTYTDGVSQGMYVPLGEGDVDIAAIVGSLENDGYAGWYVLEQDTILTGPPAETGVDPLADVRASIDFIHNVRPSGGPAVTSADASGDGGRSDG
ncbi:TIM barrel protein [Knoellia locipacati]|uniref:TIM barrel protein n=1 Tax=Knoellia locipacati TaxID=882824 RepID=UPI00384F67D5